MKRNSFVLHFHSTHSFWESAVHASAKRPIVLNANSVCLLTFASRQVRIRTEPMCVGINGAVARLDAHGVATFDNLRPQMAFGELPPSLTIYVEPPAGEEAEKLEGTLQIVPSTRPHCAELCDQEGVALEAQGASDGNGRVRVYALRAEVGSRVHGLRARVLTEAKEQVVRLDALDVECCGRSLSTEEKDAFDKDGALPTVDVPQKCTVSRLAHDYAYAGTRGCICMVAS
eukprot:6177357-Pleurochrysis_carterae.AAC.5